MGSIYKRGENRYWVDSLQCLPYRKNSIVSQFIHLFAHITQAVPNSGWTDMKTFTSRFIVCDSGCIYSCCNYKMGYECSFISSVFQAIQNISGLYYTEVKSESTRGFLTLLTTVGNLILVDPKAEHLITESLTRSRKQWVELALRI